MYKLPFNVMFALITQNHTHIVFLSTTPTGFPSLFWTCFSISKQSMGLHPGRPSLTAIQQATSFVVYHLTLHIISLLPVLSYVILWNLVHKGMFHYGLQSPFYFPFEVFVPVCQVFLYLTKAQKSARKIPKYSLMNHNSWWMCHWCSGWRSLL